MPGRLFPLQSCSEVENTNKVTQAAPRQRTPAVRPWFCQPQQVWLARASGFPELCRGQAWPSLLSSLSSCSPDVQFCGYCITHPSESKINFRIQTRGTDTAFPLCLGFFWGESPLLGSGFGPGLF